MCGIVGYVGPCRATDVLIPGLASLEYRGYDSAGVAVIDHGGLDTIRRVGKLSNLKEALDQDMPEGTVGIGHTRWATHGRPTEDNAHPHRDCTGRLAVVHNGIIENFAELRRDLEATGHKHVSDTDTETIAHLIESNYHGDLNEAVAVSLPRLRGSYAIAVVHADHPDLLVAARKDSPLIIGLGDDENIVASDIPAVLKHTREILVLEDCDVASVTAGGVRVQDEFGNTVEREVIHIDWDLAAAEKGGYDDFMLKEIHEQPRAIRETLRGRVDDAGRVQLSELEMDEQDVRAVGRVFIVACGTSYHAGLVGKHLIEDWARLPVEVDVSSEFRYRDPIVGPDTLVVAISQSGETADTLAGVREARGLGAKVVSVTNVVGSRITRESDGIIYTHAGPEIGVAATKTFVSQVAAMYVLALYLAQTLGRMSDEQVLDVWRELETVPELVQRILDDAEEVEACAKEYTDVCSSLFLGRGVGVPIAMEGALKLKEISYIHAEAYAAGEMKHGPIALITDEVPVVTVTTRGRTYEKVVSNIEEVRARNARVIAVATEGDEDIRRHSDHVLYVPETSERLSAIPAVVPLQLLSYHIAKMRGCNVDQPRNLAKSVTVE